MSDSQHGPIAENEFFLESWVVIQTDPRDQRATRVQTTSESVMPPPAAFIQPDFAAIADRSRRSPERGLVAPEALDEKSIAKISGRTVRRRIPKSKHKSAQPEPSPPAADSTALSVRIQQDTRSADVATVHTQRTEPEERTARTQPTGQKSVLPTTRALSPAKTSPPKKSVQKKSAANDKPVLLSFAAAEEKRERKRRHAAASESYFAWMRDKLTHSRWATGFFTFYLHWVLLILLAILFVHGPNRDGSLIISASMTTPAELEVVPFEELDTRAEETVEDVSEESPTETMTVADVLPSPALSPGDPALPSLPAGDAEGDDPPPIPQEVPTVIVPPTAVTQGSFTVWTEPEYPEPGHSYHIVIQVRVPERFHAGYPVTDLEGVVVGSDGYRKMIPGRQTGRLPVVNSYSRISIPIVSADEEVRDVVLVRSKALRESQRLQIEF